MAHTLTNVSNFAAFGVQWDGQDGTKHQLVNVRATSHLEYGVRAKGNDRWSFTEVVNPERFGMTGAPGSFAEFRAIADRFVNPQD